MYDAEAEPDQCGAKEHPPAGGHRDRREGEREPAEQGIERALRPSEPGVEREGEQHHVAGRGGAHAEAQQQGARARRARGARRSEAVAEPLHLREIAARVEARRPKRQLGASGGRVDAQVDGALPPQEELPQQPHAGGAVHALQVEPQRAHACHALCLAGQQRVEPRHSAVAQFRRRRAVLAAQVVVAVQPPGPQEAVHARATVAAELVVSLPSHTGDRQPAVAAVGRRVGPRAPVDGAHARRVADQVSRGVSCFPTSFHHKTTEPRRAGPIAPKACSARSTSCAPRRRTRAAPSR